MGWEGGVVGVGVGHALHPTAAAQQGLPANHGPVTRIELWGIHSDDNTEASKGSEWWL